MTRLARKSEDGFAASSWGQVTSLGFEDEASRQEFKVRSDWLKHVTLSGPLNCTHETCSNVLLVINNKALNCGPEGSRYEPQLPITSVLLVLLLAALAHCGKGRRGPGICL